MPLAALARHAPAPTAPDQTTRTEPARDWVLSTDEGGQGRVLVHNDDVTPYEFVIVVLHEIFGLSPVRAEAVTRRAHVTGRAYVTTLPIEEAKHRVGRAHGLARQAGFPLSFTIEPEAGSPSR